MITKLILFTASILSISGQLFAMAVNPTNGTLAYSTKDMISKVNHFKLERFYSSGNFSNESGLGIGWKHNYSFKLNFQRGLITLSEPQFDSIKYYKKSKTLWSSENNGKIIKRLNSLTLYSPNEATYIFNLSGKLTQVKYPEYSVKIKYNKAGKIHKIEKSNLKTIYFKWKGDHIVSIGNENNTSLYYYSTHGLLESLIIKDKKTKYSYSSSNQLISIARNGIKKAIIKYDSRLRVKNISLSNGTKTNYTYNGIKTFPRGTKKKYDTMGRLIYEPDSNRYYFYNANSYSPKSIKFKNGSSLQILYNKQGVPKKMNLKKIKALFLYKFKSSKLKKIVIKNIINSKTTISLNNTDGQRGFYYKKGNKDSKKFNSIQSLNNFLLKEDKTSAFMLKWFTKLTPYNVKPLEL